MCFFNIINQIIIISLLGQSGFVLVDSSGNGYTLLDQSQECISYNPAPGTDALIIVNRAYYHTGYLNAHEAPGDLSFWVHCTPYELQYGLARRPNAFAGQARPFYACLYLLSGGIPFSYGGGFENLGWFYNYWHHPIAWGNFSGNLVILKQITDSTFLVICKNGFTDYAKICYMLIDPSFFPIDTGTIAINRRYWGYDINGGIAAVFYFDSLNNVCYRTTTDGSHWSPEYTWDLAFTPPYPHYSIPYTQMALTDNGQPRLVFECRNLADTSYPYYGKIYVSYASGIPPVELTASLPDTEATYPTIACGGNKGVVIFNIPRNDLPDSLAWYDIYISSSIDNGITWSVPQNISSTSPYRIGLQQIAKRIDIIRNRIYFIFARNKAIDHDPLWHLLYDPEGLDPMYIYLGYTPLTNVEENDRLWVGSERLKLQVLPNIVRHNARFQCAITERQKILLELYDTIGKKVATIAEGIFEPGIYSYSLNTSSLGSGIYFLFLRGASETRTGKVLIIR